MFVTAVHTSLPYDLVCNVYSSSLMIHFKYGFSALLWYKYSISQEIKSHVLIHILHLKIKHGEKVFDLLRV